MTEAEVLAAVPKDLLIGGAWRAAEHGARLGVEDPATGETLCEVADAAGADAIAALDAAAGAQAEWGAHAPRERGEILRRAFELVAARADDLALLMTLEMGKSLAESRSEIVYANEFLRWFSEEAVRIDGRYAVSPNGATRLITMRQPVGPCLFITPWNFPLAMGTRKVAPAIAAGCTIVVKPAKQTPLSMLAFAAILEEAGLPAGVLNVVTTSDAGAVTDPLFDDPRLRKLSFTGSTEVGFCGCRWSSAATRRSLCSRTLTSTPRSTGQCSPRCATWVRRAHRRTAFTSRRRSPTSSRSGSRSGCRGCNSVAARRSGQTSAR
jgi:succinate-semialdehyde dehydrogenase/glutarate-semialdehyde dehydrogenase